MQYHPPPMRRPAPVVRWGHHLVTVPRGGWGDRRAFQGGRPWGRGRGGYDHHRRQPMGPIERDAPLRRYHREAAPLPVTLRRVHTQRHAASALTAHCAHSTPAARCRHSKRDPQGAQMPDACNSLSKTLETDGGRVSAALRFPHRYCQRVTHNCVTAAPRRMVPGVTSPRKAWLTACEGTTKHRVTFL